MASAGVTEEPQGASQPLVVEEAVVGAAPSATPHIWERFLPGFEASLLETTRRQDAVERLFNAKDIEKLEKEHSKKSSDPCRRASFSVPAIDSGVEGEVNLHKTRAVAMRAQAESTVRKVQSSVDQAVEEAGRQDQGLIKGELDAMREDALQDVRRSSDALAEVADVEIIRSRKAVLIGVHGPEAVGKMREHEMELSYESVRVARRHELEIAAQEGARKLIGYSIDTLKTGDILQQEQYAVELCSTRGELEKGRVQMRCSVQGLEKEYDNTVQKHAACKKEKAKRSSRLELSRKNLKNALKALQQAEAEFQDANIEDLVLNMQISLLGSHMDGKKNELALVHHAKELAECAFGECVDFLRVKEEYIRNHTRAGAKKVVARASQTLDTAALNTQIAITLLTRLLENREKETSMLAIEKEATLRQLKYWREQKSAKKCAELTEKLEEFASQIESCRLKQLEINESLQLAKAKQNLIEGLDKFDNFFDKSDLEKRATDMVSQAYKEFELWSNSQVAESEPAAKPSEGTLQVLNQIELIEQLKATLREEIRAELYDQMKADALFRNSAVSSECGDSDWSKVSCRR